MFDFQQFWSSLLIIRALLNKKCQNTLQSNAIPLKDCIFVAKMSKIEIK